MEEMSKVLQRILVPTVSQDAYTRLARDKYGKSGRGGSGSLAQALHGKVMDLKELPGP